MCVCVSDWHRKYSTSLSQKEKGGREWQAGPVPTERKSPVSLIFSRTQILRFIQLLPPYEIPFLLLIISLDLYLLLGYSSLKN